MLLFFKVVLATKVAMPLFARSFSFIICEMLWYRPTFCTACGCDSGGVGMDSAYACDSV